jgi:hypothetical protein
MQHLSNPSEAPAVNSEQLFITHLELAEMLVKKNGIHEGIWSVVIEFQMAAVLAGPPDHYLPSGMIGVSRVGIQKAPAVNNLSVDAAIVNPRPKKTSLPRKTLSKK